MNNDFFILLDVLSAFLLRKTNKNYSTEKIRAGLSVVRILLYVLSLIKINLIFFTHYRKLKTVYFSTGIK